MALNNLQIFLIPITIKPPQKPTFAGNGKPTFSRQY